MVLLAYLSWMLVGVESKTESAQLMWFLWASLLVGAFLATWMNPRYMLRVVISLAATAAVLAILSNTVHQARGNPVDFPGIGGALWLAAITLTYGLVLSAIGGGLARLISHRMGRVEKLGKEG